MKRLLSCGGCALLLLVFACVQPPAVVPPPPAAASDLLTRLDQLAGAFGSLKGLAKVRVSRQGDGTSVTQALFLEKPRQLRAEVLGPFGQTLAVVATDGNVLSIDARHEGTFFQGPATLENLQRLLRVPLQLDDLVRLLLYDLPRIEYQTARVEVRGGFLCLVLEGSEERRQEVMFDGDWHVTQVTYLAGDSTLLTVSYAGFAAGSGFPLQSRMEMPQLVAFAEVAFSSVELNPALAPESFRLSPPPGRVITPLPVR